MIDAERIEALRVGIQGDVRAPDDEGYDEARAVYNAMIDRRPELVVGCRDTADVIAAVRFASERGLDVAVRGGGHNVTGFGTVDGGLVIDLSPMHGIRVDPEAGTARAEGGCTWGDFDHATHAYGLATTGGLLSTTGVGGLTLGGGIGHLTRGFGLSCDNLVSADVVTPAGEVLTASADQNEDLFWAIRGGGGNFGIVTSFEFGLHPVSTVLGGPVFYPIDRTADVLRFYREFIATAPRELGAFFAFQIGPPAPFIPEHLHNVPMCAIVVCYAGPMDEAEGVVKPIREFGPPALDLVGPLPYPALQSMFDALLPPGLLHYWKADFITEISDAAIDVHVEHGPNVPTVPSTMHIYPLNGAVHDVGKDETAFSYRDAEFVHVIVAAYPDAADTDANVAWVRSYWDALRPHAAGGAYVNFLMDEGQDRVRESFRENYDRLARIKSKYDPNNLLHLNQNILPAG